MAGLDLSEAVGRVRRGMAIIPQLAEAIREMRLEDAAGCFSRIAEEETAAYTALGRVVGAPA